MAQAPKHKKTIYFALKKVKPGTRISMIEWAKDIGCSLAYLSQVFRYAKEAGFMSVNDRGDYEVADMPKKFETFSDVTAERARQYKASSSGAYGRRVPKEFVIDEATIANVVAAVCKKAKDLEKKNKVLEEKYRKALLFIQKMKEKGKK